MLRLLAAQGVIDVDDAQDAAKRPLGITEPGRQGSGYFPAFLDLVRRQLRRDYKEEDLTEAGLVVFTTLDPLLQDKAEQALTAELERLGKSGRKGTKGLEGVIVATSPQTGEVSAVVGGRRASYEASTARSTRGGRSARSPSRWSISRRSKPATTHPPPSSPTSRSRSSCRTGTPGSRELHQAQRAGAHSPRIDAVAQPRDRQPRARGRAGRVAETYVQLGLEKAPNAYPSMLLGAANLSSFRSRADLQHARQRRISLAVARRSRRNGREDKPLKAPELEVEQVADRTPSMYSPDADRSHGSRHGSTRPKGSARAWRSPARPVPQTIIATAGSRDSRAST